jgi:ribosomal protein S21
MALFFRAISRPNIITRSIGAASTFTRAQSGPAGLDKYFAPYPTLPKIDQSPAGSVPLARASSDLYSDLAYGVVIPNLTPDQRWASVHEGASRDLRDPGNVYTGRSVLVSERCDMPMAYRRLHSILFRNHVRAELFLQRRYEKPSDRERRLKSERHRRRFAAWVSSEVLRAKRSTKRCSDPQKGPVGVRDS